MNPVTLSQWQFAITSIYHFFFVPLTLGLSVLVAIMETIYVRSNNPLYKQMAKFWGKLFTINFAMGVVTGIVQEFQFGMNWANYSRFVGDIFGAPLAIEALLAFFLESTFLGIWTFGWEKLPKGLHALSIWLVALGSNLSALWILIANSFMQAPVGYVIQDGRALMSNFAQLVFNPYVWKQFPHTVFSGFTTGAFFVMAISAYHLLRKHYEELFNRSFQIANIFGLVAIALVILVGHSQAQMLVRVQPMKLAAAEALWNTENPAGFSFITIPDQKNGRNLVDLRVPYMLSVLAYNEPSGKVMGLNEIQTLYEQKYGPGYYVPSIWITYISFRLMVGVGFLLLLLNVYSLVRILRGRPLTTLRFFNVFPWIFFLPYIATTMGWMLTELGRQPWVVYGLMKTVNASSPSVTAGMVLATLIGFTLLYGVLMAADIYLLAKFSKAGPQQEANMEPDEFEVDEGSK